MGSKFKVTSLKADTKYGIVASDLENLMDKGCQKLQLSREGCRVCLFEDGTEVDAEYFSRLKDNCKLIILEQGQKWNGEIRYYLKEILHEYDNSSDELITTAKSMLSEEIRPKKRKLLQYFVEDSTENITAENRDDDQKWFEGLNPRFKTKSDYMSFSCGRRMRNYLAEGAFDEDRCTFIHSINPYGSRENRIVFSTWNLDHGIEKKRTIIPTIVKTVKQQKIDNRKVKRFYSLLFTLANLKLVHIVCHKKTEHKLSCDPPKTCMGKKRKRNSLS
ncbi:DNA fragmentation factor subunit beta isoform X5 [Scyliorhinus canicula]|uniref:DNA fragmentation factor subunit beta isoform X5 n=1 Tax=Scyliorhinus canicula TaxID=7830 RepID=UPI0018F526D8|nr:DNA fragmentation factor subunit beta isoform X5 [Scyliorhinus canicula]